MQHEIEIKIRVDDPESTAARLEGLGARLARARHFEDNTTFDLPGRPLLAARRLLRVRQTDHAVVTAKAPPEEGAADARYKVVREVEAWVPDRDEFVEALEHAGLEPLWRYQKWRREYEWEGASLVIDEIPHGAYLEIEGQPDQIDRLAAKLGFTEADWLRSTYREIHAAACAAAGRPLDDMVFPDPGPERAGESG